MAMPSNQVKAHDRRRIPHAELADAFMPKSSKPSILDCPRFAPSLCPQCKGTTTSRFWGIKPCKCICEQA